MKANKCLYPFGEKLPGRNATGAEGYRLSYQGQEKAENQRWFNFQLRMYDASLGRFLAPDPLGQFHSPYLANFDNPVSFKDPTGGWSGYVWTAEMRRQYYQKLYDRYISGKEKYWDNQKQKWMSFELDKTDRLYKEIMEWKTGLQYTQERPRQMIGSVLDKGTAYQPVIPYNMESSFNPSIGDIYSNISSRLQEMAFSGFSGGGNFLGNIIDTKEEERILRLALEGGNLDRLTLATMNRINSMEDEISSSSREIVSPGPLEFIEWIPDETMKINTGQSDYIAALHVGLDAIGLIPGIGEFADALNAVIYLTEGDYLNAGLSAAAAVPVFGAAATLGKMASRTMQLTAKARTAERGLEIGERFLGKGYREIDNGVFRSADNLRQFRMTDKDILHKSPHYNFEIYKPENLRIPIKNYHMPIKP